MRFTNKINQRGATGYILLWLLGIPIPIKENAAQTARLANEASAHHWMSAASPLMATHQLWRDHRSFVHLIFFSHDFAVLISRPWVLMLR
jgi:hypothetical protein